MQGVLAVGIFGSDKNLESSFANSIAKKGESEDSIVYHRNMGQTGFSFLDDATFPERIQRDARIASNCDHAFLIFPPGGELASSDGELAVLVDAFSLDGTIEIFDSLAPYQKQTIESSFKGLTLADFPIDQRSSNSSVVDLTSPGVSMLSSGDTSTLV